MAPILFLLLLLIPAAEPSSIGVCHGRVGTNLPPPSAVVSLLKSNGITKLRLFNPDPSVLPAFKDSGIDLMIGVPNENLTSLSAPNSSAVALDWLNTHIFAHVSPNQVRYLAVGNEILYKDPFYTPHLLPAIYNFHRALQILGLDKQIKISSPHASSVLANSYPPSASNFDPYVAPVIKPMLQFLAETGAPLMINMYPFISYANDPVNIALDFAVGGGSNVQLQDGGNGYTNLFDATVDSFVAAMEKFGFSGIPVAVTETGWPTAGNDVSTPEKAMAYNGGIVGKVLKGVGTPRRPGIPVEVYLFDLYDENGKEGADFEQHFGIFNVDGSKVYDLSFV